MATLDEESESKTGETMKILFVLGPPGAGKGTQCAKIVSLYSNIKHFSVGDLLRAAKKDATNPHSGVINKCISEGSIVPIDITIKLIENACIDAMVASKKDNIDISLFLLDGFPRNQDNLDGWNKFASTNSAIEECGVLFLSLNESNDKNNNKTDIIQERILNRNESRIDDNVQTIFKRIKTYENDTMPVIKSFSKDRLYTVDATKSVDQVTSDVLKIIKQIVGK